MSEQVFSKPLVSIVIVVFNAGRVVSQAIESVLAQNYPFKELVVIDGKSTNQTLDYIEPYKNRLGYFVSESDLGIYDAMNKGIAAARGKWIYFLGADDVLADANVLTNIFEKYTGRNAGILYGDVRFKSDNRIFGGARTYQQLIEKNISHQAIFYQKKVFDTVGKYNLRYKILADYDLNLRIFKNEDILKEYIPINICLYNDRGGASNICIDRSFFEDKLNYFLSQEKISVTNSLLQQYYFYTGYCIITQDRKLRGFAYCFRSFIKGPRKIFYVLIFIKFILAYCGIGKKIKIV